MAFLVELITVGADVTWAVQTKPRWGSINPLNQKRLAFVLWNPNLDWHLRVGKFLSRPAALLINT